jgi:hypothetical protein
VLANLSSKLGLEGVGVGGGVGEQAGVSPTPYSSLLETFRQFTYYLFLILTTFLIIFLFILVTVKIK